MWLQFHTGSDTEIYLGLTNCQVVSGSGHIKDMEQRTGVVTYCVIWLVSIYCFSVDVGGKPKNSGNPAEARKLPPEACKGTCLELEAIPQLRGFFRMTLPLDRDPGLEMFTNSVQKQDPE